MLSGLLAVLQAPFVDCVLLDPFSSLQDLVATPEVDISGCQVLQALVISPVIVVADEPADLPLEIAGEEVVFQKDAVLQGLVPSSPLAGRRLLANAERRSYPGSGDGRVHHEHDPCPYPPAILPDHQRCNWNHYPTAALAGAGH